ncbi:germination protein [Paenibacillus tyrfis]|uniref:GerAB/ArcD/ProY family transporter n=1 Tax=Paenibacillus tyrfis TaxID=1501230 RepID=UPI002493B7DC|nr:endospore germination permease [Paenibacillus tyrfis]GLI09810.1 germination protein [Paenibacillus tyrfis]
MKLEQLSSRGLTALMIMWLVGTPLSVPLAASAGHDAWISIILGAIVSYIIIWMYTHLCQLYPGKTLVEIGEVLFGAWAGRIIGFIYAWYSFHLGVLILKNFIEYILIIALPETSPLTVSAPMMGIVLWAAYAGMEVLSRCSISLLLLVLVEAMLSILMVKDFQPDNLLPLVDRGWMPILEGMTELIGFPFGESIVFAMIIPQINNIDQAKKTVLWALITSGFLLVLSNVRNTLVLGNISSKLIYPSYVAYQYISIAEFLERVEPITIVTFLLGAFVKISVCLYASAKSFSLAMPSKQYRLYLIPLSLLMLQFTFFLYKNDMEMIKFSTKIWQWYSVPFQIIIPLAMLLTALIIKRKRMHSLPHS